jgi:2-iminoacetate synthase ThiH
LTKLGMEEMVRGAGRIPVERDTLYNPIQRTDPSIENSETMPLNV